MTVLTFVDFVNAVDHYLTNGAPKSWRAGQAAFNLLRQVRPDLSDLIAGSEFDPFYLNAHLPAFYSYLARHWEA